MDLIKGVKRKFSKHSPHHKWNTGYYSWENEYETKGDISLYQHRPEKSIKYYTLALKTLGEEMSAVRKKKGNRGVEIGREIYERIEKKRARVERAFYGERKYLSGKGREQHHKSGLASKVAGVIGIIGFAGAATFAYPNITGNAIGSLTTSTSSIIGAVLFVVGLVGGFFWMKSK